MTDTGPGSAAAKSPLVLAAVGTDRHPFDRLLRWLEQWHDRAPRPPRLLVQYGYSDRPRLPGAVDFLGHGEVQAAMVEAAVVVSHGGPATITEARRAGHLPVVVPRDPARAEHVDDHQQLFTQRLHEAGMIMLCDTAGALHTALDAGLADPAGHRIAADPAATGRRAEAVARVGRIVEGLESAHRPVRTRRRGLIPLPRRRP